MTAPKPREVEFKLEFPIEFKGAMISSMKVRRPKGKDLSFLPTGADTTVDQMYPFFALLTGVDSEVFDEMDAGDLTEFGELINGFLSSKKSKTARGQGRGAR